MHVIHFADTHPDFAESSRVSPVSGVNLREKDAYDAFNSVIEEAVRRRPHLVVHAGDLFHSPRPSNRAIITAMAGFKRLSEAGIPVVLTAGNHSVPRMTTTASIFEALCLLPGVKAAYQKRYEVFDVGDAAIHCVPHARTEEALSEALSQVRARKNKRFNVLVTHGAVRGTVEDLSLGEFNEVAILAKLVELFKAFQGDLIARVGPQIEEHASRLLEQMTRGRYSRMFLDGDYKISIDDAGQPHPLQRFSGGEEDLANLCLRIAISQLVAQRSGGATSSLLVLDEVFGSQDIERRERILQARNRLQDMFQQILLITHMEDIHERVPNTLRVTEDGARDANVTAC